MLPNDTGKKPQEIEQEWKMIFFVVVSQTGARRAVYAERDDGRVVVILFLKAMLQSWRPFMDTLRCRSSGPGSGAIPCYSTRDECTMVFLAVPPLSRTRLSSSNQVIKTSWFLK